MNRPRGNESELDRIQAPRWLQTSSEVLHARAAPSARRSPRLDACRTPHLFRRPAAHSRPSRTFFAMLVGMLFVVTCGCRGGRDIRESVEAIKSDDPDVRRQAIMEVGEEGDPRAIKVVAAVLAGDPDRLVRAAAAAALGKMKSSWATPHLVKALQDKEYIVRWDAVRALGRIGDESALPSLKRSLQRDSNGRVRSAAIAAIVKIAESSPTACLDAIEALIGALRDRNESIALAASIGLSELTGRSFGMNQAAWVEWWDANKDRIASEREKGGPNAQSDGASPIKAQRIGSPERASDKAEP